MGINQKRVANPAVGHQNHMGGTSYGIKNPITQLRVVAGSCFFGQKMFYNEDKSTHEKIRASENRSVRHLSYAHKYLGESLGECIRIPGHHLMTPTALVEAAIKEALDYDPEATLAEAARLRTEDGMRDTPQVIMVMAAHHEKVRGTGMIKKYAGQILSRTDDVTTQLAYQLMVYGRPIPNALKKAWKTFIEGRTATQLAKYRMESRQHKLVDVVNLVRAKGEAVDSLMRGELTLDGATWESLISSKGSNKETWSEAVGVMGHMALLRNIRNLLKFDVPQDLYLEKLVRTAKGGKQLPFRYYTAYQALEEVDAHGKGRALDAIEECLMVSLDDLPKFNGRVMSLCDNSGSAQGGEVSEMGSMMVSQIGNLSAVITGMVSDDGYAGVFGDTLKIVPIRKKASVFDQTKQLDKIGLGIGQGTEHGIWTFFDNAIKNNEHWDHIFVYSDMQAGHGGLYGDESQYRDYRWNGNGGTTHCIDVAKLIKEYRKKVNKDVHIYLVQIAGYPDTLVPEYYDKTYVLGGWGSGLLKFAHHMSSVK